MSQNFKVLQIFKYVLSPKSSSYSCKSWKNNAPEVHLDSLFQTWGLVTGKYRDDGAIETTNYGKLIQKFFIFYSIIYLIDVIITMILKDDSVWIYYLGDPSVMIMKICPRIYFQMLIIPVLLKTILILLYFDYNQSNGKLIWLEIPKLIKGIFYFHLVLFNFNLFLNC
jgi:hypothetical protein